MSENLDGKLTASYYRRRN